MRALALLLAAACTAAPPVDDPAALAAARAVAASVEVDQLMPWVRQLAADHLDDVRMSCAGYTVEDKYPACELSRDRAVALVRDALAGFGYQPRVESLGAEPEVAHNVIAERRGATRPDEVVLVAAHMDAFYAGADDNSSGVAVLLEVARAFAPLRTARTVRFVGFDLEERGSAGSARHVAAGGADDVVAALVLETVGFASHEPGSQDEAPGLPFDDVGDFLAIAANGDSRELAQRILAMNHAAPFVKLEAYVVGGDGAYPLTATLLRSDNGPMWLHGIPALMLTDTANFRNPSYHEAGDLPETLDPEFLAGVARLTAAATALFAEVLP